MKKLLLILVVFASLNAQATEYFSVGGGYAPAHSEVSLENNMLQFLKLISPGATQSVFFGAGSESEICDVIEKTPVSSFSDVVLGVFGTSSSRYELAQCRYRHNKIPNLQGPASKVDILEGLEQIAQRRDKTDNYEPFRFYYTGHGGKGSSSIPELLDQFSEADRRKRYDLNRMYLWNDDEIDVQDFTKSLDLFPAEVPVQILMTQCYAGGFAQINFKGGNLLKGSISDADRCGFFAQIESRTSVGCTADALDNIYYSNYFFEAYQKAEKEDFVADYNRDGIIGGDEAHAYAMIHSPTEDIPVKTSDMLLKDFRDLNPGDMLEDYKRIPWNKIESRLTPAENAVIRTLSETLFLHLDENQGSPKNLIQAYMDDSDVKRTELSMSIDQLTKKYEELKNQVSFDLQGRFPLAFVRSDLILDQKLKQESIQSFNLAIKFLMSNKKDLLESLESQYKEIQTKKELLDRMAQRYAMANRMLIIINSKLMESAIQKNMGKTLVYQKYQQLKKCESEPFFTE